MWLLHTHPVNIAATLLFFAGNKSSEKSVNWRCQCGGQHLSWPRSEEKPWGQTMPVWKYDGVQPQRGWAVACVQGKMLTLYLQTPGHLDNTVRGSLDRTQIKKYLQWGTKGEEKLRKSTRDISVSKSHTMRKKECCMQYGQEWIEVFNYISKLLFSSGQGQQDGLQHVITAA